MTHACEVLEVRQVLEPQIQVERLGDQQAAYVINPRQPQKAFPPCIKKLLSMRPPETPTPTQSFHLACFLLQQGYDIEDCKDVLKEIFQQEYEEDTADIHLKIIKGKGCKPFQCFMVKHGLGLCSPDCPRHEKI
ncbi:MAG: hypothetical protein GF334_09515 [Candidatus Altiarchaeales archaeon]|nr:hypothetical protein [Candidatus Altiarchaeales archaeon]